MVSSTIVASYLKQRLKVLPAKPGVYLFKDDALNVLYIGKAVSLRHRVSSYFTPPSNLPLKLQQMMARVADFEFFITDSE